jgi:hypothetical protein
MPDAIANQDWTALADFGKVRSLYCSFQLVVSNQERGRGGLAHFSS